MPFLLSSGLKHGRVALVASAMGVATLLIAGGVSGCLGSPRIAEPAAGGERARTVRLGYFPNLTHAQALIGVSSGRFQSALGDAATLEPVVMNAGPSVVEALFAGRLDMAYLGPNPAINGYVRSEGRALRIIAGATSGGAALVVGRASGIEGPADLSGRKVASPQIGNTQDVALRAYLERNGLAPGDGRGSVTVLPMANPDVLTLFKRGELDGAWVPEPWVTILVRHGDGRVLVDERTLWPGRRFASAVLVARPGFLVGNGDLVDRLLAAHVDETLRISREPRRAVEVIDGEIARLTGAAPGVEVIREAFSRVEFTYDPLLATLSQAAQDAFDLGYLGSRRPDLSGIHDPGPLDEVLRRKGLESPR